MAIQKYVLRNVNVSLLSNNMVDENLVNVIDATPPPLLREEKEEGLQESDLEMTNT